MAYLLRAYNCTECGKPVTRKRHSADKRACVDCGIKAAVDAARQMAGKSGPAYDAFLASKGPRGRPRKTRE